MAQNLKSWESPRRQGRNAKGKGGSARQRQLKKQYKMLRKKLKGETQGKETKKRTHPGFSFLLGSSDRSVGGNKERSQTSARSKNPVFSKTGFLNSNEKGIAI